jgi:hypothetical protein
MSIACGTGNGLSLMNDEEGGKRQVRGVSVSFVVAEEIIEKQYEEK